MLRMKALQLTQHSRLCGTVGGHGPSSSVNSAAYNTGRQGQQWTRAEADLGWPAVINAQLIYSDMSTMRKSKQGHNKSQAL